MTIVGVGAGVGFGAPPPSAMDLLPSLVAWWEPGRGVTLSAASVDDAISTWSALSAISAPVSSDHPDGLQAYTVTEASGTSQHVVYKQCVNGASGPASWEIDVRAAVGYARIRGPGDEWNIGLNLTTGEVYWQAGLATTVTVTAIANWWRVSIYAPAGSANYHEIGPHDGSTDTSFASGDPLRSITAARAVFTGHRCSALADHSGHGYILAQSTPASQIFVQKADGSSPGGNLWANRASIWQPNDVAKTAVCTVAGLLAAMQTDHTFVADVYITAAATAAVPLFATAGGVAIVYGIDTSRRPYVTCGTTLTGTALAVGRHRLAFVYTAATATWAIYAEGAIDGVPTVLVPGGAISPTSVTLTQRCMGFIKGGLAGTGMSIPQIAAEHAAMLLEAP